MSTTAAPRSHHPNVHVERDGHVVTVTLERALDACQAPAEPVARIGSKP